MEVTRARDAAVAARRHAVSARRHVLREGLAHAFRQDERPHHHRVYFLFGLGATGLRNTERDVFNNLFVQIEKVPGTGFAGIKRPGNVRGGGNLLWGLQDGPALTADPFAKFRASALFAASKKFYEPGLTTHDRVTDPKFVNLPADDSQPVDLRLQPGSPALSGGQRLPTEWPESVHAAYKDGPHIRAIPLGVQPWGVGVNGRILLFRGRTEKR